MKRFIHIFLIVCLITLGNIGKAQTSSTFSSPTPLIFTSTGTGLYNKSVIYHSYDQGLLIDLARSSNSATDVPLNFKIDARGGGYEAFFIEGSSGNVGIGTSSPNVLGFGNNSRVLTLSASSTSGTAVLEFDGARDTDNQSVGFIPFVNYNNRILDLIVRRQDNGNSGSMTIRTNNGLGGLGSSNMVERFTINQNGNVGIGTTTPQSKLSVNGIITTQEVNITDVGWSDFVFREDYALKPLEEIEDYIRQNHHLPAIPSAEEVAENGIMLGEMDAKLLQKIEELTLYLIEMKKENQEIKAINQNLLERIEKLEK